ncbi:hypothetical protein [Leminorella richardii]|nr:hypothetical protein [Leminorella richardii]
MKIILPIIDVLRSLIGIVFFLVAIPIYWIYRLFVLFALFVYHLPRLLHEREKEKRHQKNEQPLHNELPPQTVLPALNTLNAEEFLRLTERDIQEKLGVHPEKSCSMDWGMSVARWCCEDGYIECWFQSGECYDCSFRQSGNEIDHAVYSAKK